MAAVTTLLHEVKTVKNAHENVERERDKLKSDLQVEQKMGKTYFNIFFEKVANERSCSLAAEIDEQHAQQEHLIQNHLKVDISYLNFKSFDSFRNLNSSYTMLRKIVEKT